MYIGHLQAYLKIEPYSNYIIRISTDLICTNLRKFWHNIPSWSGYTVAVEYSHLELQTIPATLLNRYVLSGATISGARCSLQFFPSTDGRNMDRPLDLLIAGSTDIPTVLVKTQNSVHPTQDHRIPVLCGWCVPGPRPVIHIAHPGSAATGINANAASTSHNHDKNCPRCSREWSCSGRLLL